MRRFGQLNGILRGLLAPAGVAQAASGHTAAKISAGTLIIQNVTADSWLLAFSGLIGAGCVVALIAWRIRDRMQIRRQTELRLAVQHRTEQLEHGQEIEASRNRILEMLVSNEPLGTVLDAIARAVREQIPDALCAVLVRKDDSGGGTRAKQPNDFFVGAAPVVPPVWLTALSHQGAVPFEVWRQRCEYLQPRSEPAWETLIGQIDAAGLTGGVPFAIRSVPIGETALSLGSSMSSSLGALLLFYPERCGTDPWERLLAVSARLAHVAIDHRRFCDQLDYQAHHDSLTGLPNRVMLEERLESAVMESRLRDERLAFLYLDVDGFKQINDRFSHRTGDVLLMEIGNRLSAQLRSGDTLARIGGDEFNVVLPDVGDSVAALELASRLLETVRQPFTIGGYDLRVTLSVGIAMFPDDGQDAPDLQRQADAAMYYAKSLGKNRAQAFADNARSLDSVRMEQDLRHALQEGWFVVYYQPKFTAGGYLAGMEALIRLNHPRHGQILPGQFIPIAEATELIVPIGAWVISEVCRQLAAWRARNLAPVAIAVNVSAIQISDPGFAKSVEACLAAYSVPAACLELEVTESMLVNADGEEHRQMQLLRAIGVSVSIDDFGTGFSSLSYLYRLSVDAVKLDRSFVQTIGTDRGAQQLVRAVIGVAQGLGLDVIAEGVETEAQRLELVAAGCPVMQGYLFAHPAPPETVEALLNLDLMRPNSPGGDLSRLYSAIEAASRPASVLTMP